jgi:hypothetical protein
MIYQACAINGDAGFHLWMHFEKCAREVCWIHTKHEQKSRPRIDAKFY